MKIRKQEMQSILNNLADLVEFYEEQSSAGVVDGKNDPYGAVRSSIRILDQMCPGWRGSICLIKT